MPCSKTAYDTKPQSPRSPTCCNLLHYSSSGFGKVLVCCGSNPCNPLFEACAAYLYAWSSETSLLRPGPSARSPRSKLQACGVSRAALTTALYSQGQLHRMLRVSMPTWQNFRLARQVQQRQRSRSQRDRSCLTPTSGPRLASIQGRPKQCKVYHSQTPDVLGSPIKKHKGYHQGSGNQGIVKLKIRCRTEKAWRASPSSIQKLRRRCMKCYPRRHQSWKSAWPKGGKQ
jgi:hypothetical protein